MYKNLQFQGKESFHRMNYLYQASHLLTKIPEALDVATSLGNTMVGVSKKSVLRMEPALKRTVCKGCYSVLMPGITARVRVRKKPSAHVVWTCLRCCTSKKFIAKRNYQLWVENLEAVVQVISCDITAPEKSKETTKKKENGEAVKCVTTELDNLAFEKMSNAAASCVAVNKDGQSGGDKSVPFSGDNSVAIGVDGEVKHS